MEFVVENTVTKLGQIFHAQQLIILKIPIQYCKLLFSQLPTAIQLLYSDVYDFNIFHPARHPHRSHERYNTGKNPLWRRRRRLLRELGPGL